MADAIETLTRKDFVSDQEVRWCPGCGDYAILAQMQRVLPEMGIAREDMVFISGIGLFQPLSLLHEHVRSAHHSRSCSNRGDWPQSGQSRPARMGHHRRWRQPVHRRQSPVACAASQRRSQHHSLQQRRSTASPKDNIRPHRRRARAPIRRPWPLWNRTSMP